MYSESTSEFRCCCRCCFFFMLRLANQMFFIIIPSNGFNQIVTLLFMCWIELLVLKKNIFQSMIPANALDLSTEIRVFYYHKRTLSIPFNAALRLRVRNNKEKSVRATKSITMEMPSNSKRKTCISSAESIEIPPLFAKIGINWSISFSSSFNAQ